MMKMSKRFSVMAVCFSMLICGVFAGNLNSPAAPTDPASAMYMLEDLYNRLTSGAAGSKRSGGFAEPSSGPGSSMHSLNEIMEKAPVIDATGALPGEILVGRKYWGLTAGQWGLQTGTMTDMGAMNITPGNATQTITRGYHNGSGRVAGDANVVTGNIKAGATIFGIPGDPSVVDTSTGNATPGEILMGRQAWVDGSLATGTRCGGTVLKPGGSFSTGGRWYDNNDGTITDTVTGLVWMKSASTQERYYAATATTDTSWYVYTLQSGVSGLSDGSANGDWRLPTLKELNSLKTGTEPISSSSIPNSGFGPIFTTNFSGVYFWSSTNYSTNIAETMVVSVAFYGPAPIPRPKADTSSTAGVWAVRSKL